MNQRIVQITAGRGPAECCRVVAKVTERLLKEAPKAGLAAVVLDRRPGDLNGTFLSVTLQVSGKETDSFLLSWQGTIQWIAQSPYRRLHKRKNWYVGVE